MENYEIKNNDQFNSREVYFSGKPDEAIRTALKDLKMRWNPAKCCWYGFAGQREIIEAITGAVNNDSEPKTGVILSDGYMGATRIDGINSNKHLYGSNLSDAVRKHLKAANINGCTVSIKTYSGGQSLTVKVRVTENDLLSVDEYAKIIEIRSDSWYYPYDSNAVRGEKYYSMNAKEQEKFRYAIAKKDINLLLTSRQSINQYYLDSYKEFKPEFREKIRKIDNIIMSYRRDDSNGMVDYFDTNFYYDIETVPAK